MAARYLLQPSFLTHLGCFSKLVCRALRLRCTLRSKLRLGDQLGFNLIAEALTTPAYGEYCEDRSGRLIHLSDEPVLQGETPYGIESCQDPNERFFIRPGDGRRPFSTFASQTGYYFFDKVLESGHYWTTLAALWGLLDPEAYVLGVDGDAGTYAISFYDWYTDEVTELLNSLLVNDYPAFAPRAYRTTESDPQNSVRLQYPRLITQISDADGRSYDPETGSRILEEASGVLGLCESCEASIECRGYTGRYGGVYCETFDEESVCVKDCTYAEDSCPPGTECSRGSCLPTSGSCIDFPAQCNDNNPYGACDDGQCESGRCQTVSELKLVEAEPTFSLATDIFWFGFLFTTSSFSTLFNDQLNVFRTGSRGRVRPNDDTSETVSFTNPISGVTYEAVQTRCPDVAEVTYGGPEGECGRCDADSDCAGYTRFLGGSFCQPIDETENYFCLQDCTEDPQACGPDRECDDAGNCIPTSGSCPPVKPCSLTAPQGACDTGETCINGECVRAFVFLVNGASQVLSK